MNPKTQYQNAGQFLAAENYEKASELYLKLVNNKIYAPYAYYRLAHIANLTNDPLTAKSLYYKAFSLNPDICNQFLSKEHPNHSYRFPGKKDEPTVEVCPLCGKKGEPYWCYNLLEVGSTHVQFYNPVRLWMHCKDCHHLYADEFPIQKIKYSKSNTKPIGMPTKTNQFSGYSELLGKLGQITQGSELLEIGLGGSECSLVAQEMGFNVFGIDISEGCVYQAQQYGINAEIQDFAVFQPIQKWDIIIMGDVIEHVTDPVASMEKVYGILNEGGCIWLSTPNFDGAFSHVAGHKDPMRREATHKNYFSRHSLFGLLERFHLVPVDYRLSSHYNGSVEVIAVKGDGH